jgi:RND superfamily putative drug exporter
MGPLSRFAVNRPKTAVLLWFAFMALIFVLANRFAGDFNDSFELPESESTSAQEILTEEFGAASGFDSEVRIVYSPESGPATDPAVVEAVAPVLDEISQLDAVEQVVTPEQAAAAFEEQAAQAAEAAAAQGADPAEGNPGGTAGDFLSPVSPDGTVAYATATFEVVDDVVDTGQVLEMLDIVDAANAEFDGSIQMGVQGSLVDFAGEEPGGVAELVGISVALVILLILFGSAIAAGLPIVTALFGLVTGLTAVTIFTRFVDIPEFAPTLATMIGLGVGIDYSLFVINRQKFAVDAGRGVRAAAIETVETSGRAVLTAAITVVIALGGLFILQINFISGLATASMLTVAAVALSALFLLPALLSWMGTKAFAWKLPWARRRDSRPAGTFFAKYGQWVQARPIPVAIVALLVMLTVAIPALSLRQGFPDAGGRAEGSPARIGYDLLSEGYGPGINGPFFLVMELPEPGALESAAVVIQAVDADPGVAGVTAPFPNDVENLDASVAAIATVYPTTSPQAAETAELLDRLRDEVVPAAEADGGAVTLVGGSQAITTDFGKVLSDALPLFIAVVVLLGFLVLGALFRAIVVPITGVLSSVLSFGAAMGVTVAVFQWGWGADLIGLQGTGPIAPFVPIFVFAILFGLSMDYHVFLVSRMREEWGYTQDNHRSVLRGVAGSGRVVAAAALILSSVFLAFVAEPDPIIKLFGVALATALLLDAFVIRLTFIPAVMTLIGKANWWLPGPLDRLLPHLELESDPEAISAEDRLLDGEALDGDETDAEQAPEGESESKPVG